MKMAINIVSKGKTDSKVFLQALGILGKGDDDDDNNDDDDDDDENGNDDATDDIDTISDQGFEK